jgi:hypothetical protein
MATPLLRPLRTQGGTIYVFNSAANDIAKTFSDDNVRFTFSKFAALDLPEVNQPSSNSNNIVWQALGNRSNTAASNPTTWSSDTVITDLLGTNQQQNTYIANSFQNYVLNWENLVLNTQNSNGNLYDTTSNQSVTERIFWKWLADLGAIRYDNATLNVDSNVTNMFVEEAQNTTDSSKDTYNRVVKYLGDIDLINNVNRGGEAYTQVYLHMPSEHGNTPTVLFNTLSDANYNTNIQWSGTNGEDIEGRTSVADPRMSKKAYFADDALNEYSTENAFGATANTTIEVASDINFTNKFNVNLSNMDGAIIDWDSSKYTKVTNNANVSSISELNSTAEAENFAFNTVLLYYDIFNVSDGSLVKRNLYGVLFIDDFKQSLTAGSELKSFSKFKPNPITKLNGNAYSLKTNIKFDTSADNVGVERSINEYSTFSMDLFSDAMVQLQDATENFVTQELSILGLNTKVDNLEKFYFNQATIDELNAKISTLSTSVQNALIALESPSTIIELIRNNSTRLSKLAAGELTSVLSYDLSPFVQGAGLKLDKSVPGKVIISNIIEGYNYFPVCYNTLRTINYSSGNGTVANIVSNPDDNNILSLGQFTNYFKNETVETLNINNDVIINIDDTVEKFKTGQVFRIVFDKGFSLATARNLYIYTDATNKKQLGAYKWLVAKLNNVDLSGTRPIIEIICTNANTYSFTIDVLR